MDIAALYLLKQAVWTAMHVFMNKQGNENKVLTGVEHLPSLSRWPPTYALGWNIQAVYVGIHSSHRRKHNPRILTFLEQRP